MHLWDSLRFGNGLDPGELWSKLPRRVEPEQGEHEAVKKKELLPQEETGEGGRKWASVEPSSCKKVGRGKKFQAENGTGSGMDWDLERITILQNSYRNYLQSQLQLDPALAGQKEEEGKFMLLAIGHTMIANQDPPPQFYP